MTTLAPAQPVITSLVTGWVYTFTLHGGMRITGRYAYRDGTTIVVIDTRDLMQKRLSTVSAVELVDVRSDADTLAAEPWE